MTETRAKLLVVDDDPHVRSSMSFLLTQLGYQVEAAEDGFAALSSLRRQSPDIIVSDLNMPGMSGFELLSVIRRRFPAIGVIAMSGAFSGVDRQPGVAADVFYEKATSLHSLVESLHALAKQGKPHMRPTPDDPALIWIASNGHTDLGIPFVTIGCPDCLRTFRQHLHVTADFRRHAACVHCGFEIAFAVIESTNPALPQAMQLKT